MALAHLEMMLGLDEWRSGRNLRGWARPFVAAGAALRGPGKVQDGHVRPDQMVCDGRKDRLSWLSRPRLAALEKE